MHQPSIRTLLKYALILSAAVILLILTDVFISVTNRHLGAVYYTALWLIPALTAPAVGLWAAVLGKALAKKGSAAVLMPAATVLFIVLSLVLYILLIFSGNPLAGFSAWVTLLFLLLPLSASLAVQFFCIRLCRKRGIRL